MLFQSNIIAGAGNRKSTFGKSAVGIFHDFMRQSSSKEERYVYKEQRMMQRDDTH